MSDVLSDNKISVSKSYDSIRKMIVLLDFYRFWVTVKLKNEDKNLSIDDSLSEIYLEETNACLYQCGYEELYAGNPSIGFSCVVLEAKILLNILERSLENYGRRNLTIMNCNHLDYQTVLYPYELYGVINICL